MSLKFLLKDFDAKLAYPDLTSAISQGGACAFEVLPADFPCRPSRLTGDVDFDFIKNSHNFSNDKIAANGIFLSDGFLIGSGFVSNDLGEIAYSESIYPGYFKDRFLSDTQYETSLFTQPLRNYPALSKIFLDCKVAIAFHPNFVYGHFIIEMLGRLYCARKLLDDGHAFKVVWPSNSPLWSKEILQKIFQDHELFFYDSRVSYVEAEGYILLPQLNASYVLHPAFNDVSELIFRSHGIAHSEAPNSKIFLSRSKHKSAQQGITNYMELEYELERKGFNIINPESLSFYDQLDVYSKASMVVSDFNSSLHNSIFLPFGAKFLITNWFNHYQHSLCATRSQHMHFILPKDGFYRNWTARGTTSAWYEVDISRVLDGIDFLSDF